MYAWQAKVSSRCDAGLRFDPYLPFNRNVSEQTIRFQPEPTVAWFPLEHVAGFGLDTVAVLSGIRSMTDLL